MSTIMRPFMSSFRRTALQTPQRLLPSMHSRSAHSDYGSGNGDPKGEKPQDQGANPSADKEHPGPPPPKVGQGSGSSPTKGTAEGHSKPDQSSSNQKRQFSTIRRLNAEKKPKSTEGLSPKILDESTPTDQEAPEDVKKHNEDFEKRVDRASMGAPNEGAPKDKVSSKFWSGNTGTEEKK